jgi:tetratricopeptide (TPR) repeat protein
MTPSRKREVTMKSEHRHELAENDLSKLITRGLQKIEPYHNYILAGMLVITVAVLSVVMLTRSSSAERSAGFAELVTCKTADDYLNVAEQFDGEVSGNWARLRAGEEFLHEGIRLSVSDRTQSTDRLEEAQECFDKLLQNKSVGSQVREKALYGMAMTLESLGEDTEKAISAYQALIDEFSDSRYRPMAEDRIDVLKTGRAQQFYAWFEAQHPSPEDRPLPRDMPDFGSSFGTQPEEQIGGLPPPPPVPQRGAAGPAAPEPPADAGASEGPALPAPGNDARDEGQPQEPTPDAGPDGNNQ